MYLGTTHPPSTPRRSSAVPPPTSSLLSYTTSTLRSVDAGNDDGCRRWPVGGHVGRGSRVRRPSSRRTRSSSSDCRRRSNFRPPPRWRIRWRISTSLCTRTMATTRGGTAGIPTRHRRHQRAGGGRGHIDDDVADIDDLIANADANERMNDDVLSSSVRRMLAMDVARTPDVTFPRPPYCPLCA